MLIIPRSFPAVAAVQSVDPGRSCSVVPFPPWSNAVVLVNDNFTELFVSERTTFDEVIATLVAGSSDTEPSPPESLHFFVDNLASATAEVRFYLSCRCISSSSCFR